jgi:very-short-patch-repair endonuclease
LLDARKRWDLKRRGFIFCSRACHYANATTRPTEAVCPTCKKTFGLRMNQRDKAAKGVQVFCSHRCYGFFRHHTEVQRGYWDGRRGMTPPHKLLTDAFPELEAEHQIRAPMKRATYYLDLADPITKVAIEVDGGGHQLRKFREKDHVRDAHLVSLGWRVYRFRNEEILENPTHVITTIKRRLYERRYQLRKGPTR